MRWFGSVALVAGVTGCGAEAGEVALEGPNAPGQATFAPDELTELYLVELDEPSRSRGGLLESLELERLAFKEKAALKALRYRERFSFHGLWNGISVQIGAADAAELAQMPGVRAVFPMMDFELDDTGTTPADPGTPTSDPELAGAITMSGAAAVHQTGLTGEGVFVAVIDSGIDVDHPDLGGCFGPGCKVARGWDFVGDNYDGANPSQAPVPDDNPDDCGGHGSHVAGIIGASGLITGVAPDVTLGAYRVFGCSGSTNADIMIAAMERARDDGARVVNMSIGSPFAWPAYPTAVAASQLVDDGVVVVTSTGNSGGAGLWAAGAPGVGEKVIATAAVNNIQVTSPIFVAGPEDTPIAYNRGNPSPLIPTSGTFPLARTGTTASADDACVALPSGSLTGQVALIRRGGCAFYIKSMNAAAAGAVGVVIYNNIAGPITPGLSGTPSVPIPVVGVTDTNGLALNALLDQGATTITWTNQVITAPSTNPHLIVNFSSYGLTATLDFKPDIAAPGEFIWSTVPLEQGGYVSQGGTSMASPHVAGTVALLLQAQPGVQASMVRNILQNTAVPIDWNGDPTLGIPEQAFRQGAGMVRIDRAIQATTVISPSKLALGESLPGPHQVTLTLQNFGDTDETYTVSHVAAPGATGDHFTPVAETVSFAEVLPTPSTVTVPAGGTETVSVEISPNAALPEGALYGGYVLFTPTSGDGVLRVPYAGYKGDYQLVPTIVPTANNYPWLARFTGNNADGVAQYANFPNGSTFTMTGGDVPYVVMFINHSPRKLIMDVFEANTMKPWGRAREVDYVFQNNSPTARNGYVWNGTAVRNGKTVTVPNGNYLIKVRLLRALGDESNPAHWDNWTTPVITVNRP